MRDSSPDPGVGVSPGSRNIGHRNTNHNPRSRAATPTDYAFYDENYRGMWNRGISRKIGESAFVQQTLPTYRLSWSPLKICPCLLLIGALFIGLGVGIKTFSDNIQEVIIPYTNCTSNEDSRKTCFEILNSSRTEFGQSKNPLSVFHVDANDIENCTCLINFKLDEPLKGTVYIYYTLANFYQNHLDYYLSRDENQLKGNLFNGDGKPREPSSACKPFANDSIGRIIYPCGLMANSMFTDVITLFYQKNETEVSAKRKKARNFLLDENDTNHESDSVNSSRNQIWEPVPLIRTGIAWESDRMDKYDNPDEFENAKNPIWTLYTKPPGWKKWLWELDPLNASNNGVQNEDFIVWMRAAAFPWFRKLYRIVDQREPFENGLPAGNYYFHIEYNYDVSSFEGGKEIILTNSSMVAGKNMFLAIVYMATGGLCIFMAIALFIMYKCTGSMQFTKTDLKTN